MKIAVLFDNFGPYHLARLRAAAELSELQGVEFGGRSDEYVWERSAAEKMLRTITLFPDTSSQQVCRSDFKNRLAETLHRFHPAAVAIPGWSGRGAFLALQWCLRNQVPAIVMSESTAVDETRSGWREWIKKQYVRLCSAGLVGGKPHATYLALLGMTPERIFQGYDAVDNEYFAAGAAQARNEEFELRSKYQLPKSYFLASARFIPKKNLTRLIEAYARYRALHSAIANPHSAMWSLVLLGDGELRSELESQVSSRNLSEFVRMPGFVQYPDLPAYYGLASTFIHASTSEQWGLVVNEAMASGLPVLISDRCGCAPDLVQEGVNGFIFDPFNVEQLAALMLKISTLDESRLSSLAQASQDRIKPWGPDRFGSELKAAAECAVQSGPKTPNVADRVMFEVLLRR